VPFFELASENFAISHYEEKGPSFGTYMDTDHHNTGHDGK